MMRVEWRGQPVWIVHRTKEMLEAVKATDDKVADPKSERKPAELTPEYARNEYRSIKPEYLVVVGICSHLGCSPSDRLKAAPRRSTRNGRAVSIVPATARCLISRAASTRTSRPRTI